MHPLTREAGLAGDPGDGDALVVGGEDGRVQLGAGLPERPLEFVDALRRLLYSSEKSRHLAEA